MSKQPFYAVDELVRHRGDMSLLDTILDYGDNWLEAQATLTSDNLFLLEGVVPSWVGIEYMAQTVAAWAGARAQSRGEPVKVGFLVGTRKYQSQGAAFPVGSLLTIRVTQVMTGDNGLGVFDCQLQCEPPEGPAFTANARLNVFQPDDFTEVLGEEA